jgi:hypothetical protein
MRARFDGSFGSYYAMAKIEGWSDKGVDLHKMAIEHASNLEDLLPERLMLAEVTSDHSTRKALSKELFGTKMLYPSLLNYSYNVLMSVGERGILIVQGESATIPLWLLQDVMNVRADVSVLNLELAANKSYLHNWMVERKLNGTELLGSMDAQALMGKLPGLNASNDFYFGLTLADDRVNSIEEQLYVVGLTSIHRNNTFDNYGMLKENIEKKFLLDYLTVECTGEPKTATGRVYETNYILPFLLMKEYYDKTGDVEAAENWRDKILTLLHVIDRQ